MIAVGENKAVIVKGDYTPAEMWHGKSRNLINVPELNFHRPVLNANYPALSKALNQLDRSKPYRLWYKLDTDGSGGNLGKRAYVHAYYTDPALKPEKLTENGQAFYIKGELNSILIYGSNEEDATYNRFYDFCLTADGSDPREYTSPNEGTKISGWHEAEMSVPSSMDGTYNDAVAIAAKGVGLQKTYEATEAQTGKLVQMELPAGQPLDITAYIAAKETSPTTSLVTTSVPATFENTVEGDIKLKAYGRSEQQVFEKTEPVTGSFVQMELPAGQQLDVVVNIEAEQDGEGEPSPENVRAIHGYASVSLTVCGKNIIDKQDSLISAIREETALSSWASSAFDCEWVRSHLKPNTTYRISYEIECIRVPEYDTEFASNAGLLLYSPKKGSVGRVGKAYLEQGQKLTVNDTFTTPTDIDNPALDYHFLVYTNRYLKDGKGVHSSMVIRNLQITVGKDTEDGYLPYIGRTKHISLPGISYGGYIDWAKKKYIQTHGMIIVDGSQAYTYRNTRGSVWLKPPNYKERQTGLICDKYRNIGVHDADKFVLGTCSSDGWLNFFVRNDPWESTAELKSVLAADPITVVYELAEPVEFDLSDQFTDELVASPDGITTICSNQTSVTANGAAVPSPMYPSEIVPSNGTAESTGKNILELLPDTNTSGSSGSTTIYLTVVTNELAGMAKVKPGERYVFTREFAGGQLRYFFYEEYPLDSGIVSMSGRYCNSGSCKEEIIVPENAYYLAIRVSHDKVNLPAGKCMLTRAEASDKYGPYYPATQVPIPWLRAIPDKTGGWSVRDELVSVPAMPGWYDLTRNVAEYIIIAKHKNNATS